MSEPRLNTELLRTFVAVIEADGFNRAAELLHKTPSTVSQQIQRLEAEVGVSLFDADGRKRRLSAAGERFLGYARRLLSLQEEAVAAVSEQVVAGELRLGVAQGLSVAPFPDIVARFARRYPGVRLHVDVACSCNLETDFGRGDYDAILTIRRNSRGPGRVLGQAGLEWIAAEGFEWDPQTPLPLAAFAPVCAFRDNALDALNGAGIPWDIVYTTNSLPGLMAAVRSGLAVTARTGNALIDGCVIAGPALGLPRLAKVNMVLRQAKETAIGELIEDLFVSNPPRVA